MRRGPSLRGAVDFLVRNWPLKLAAVVVATLLYAGLVVSQDSDVYPGPITITPVNQPSGTVRINDLRDVEDVRYIAPADVGRLTADDFQATVDLAEVDPTGQPASVRVDVVPVDPRVTIIDYRPRTIQVVLDESVSTDVPVRVDRGSAPAGLELGETRVDPETVTVTGPSTLVRQVVAARVTVILDPGGIDVDREIEPDPIDARGEVVKDVDVEPQTVHVSVPVFTDRESRTLPVNPILNGTPAAGFRVASISASPLAVSVEGDQDQLEALVWADTAPVAVFGATSDVSATVTLALPDGIVPLGDATIDIVVRIEAVTETRTYAAGIRLDGQDGGLIYDPGAGRVLLTLFGPVSDLDRLGSAPLSVGLNVAGLGSGSYDLPVVPSLPAGVTLVRTDPGTITVTITERVTPAPTATPAPEPSIGPGPDASPSSEP